jgi:dTDP-4-dehydrorhamnose 3,5-epimerase-like enzyme
MMVASPVEHISGAMLFTPALHADERGFFSPHLRREGHPQRASNLEA